MDLCVLVHITSLGGISYIFVMVDDYSRFTLVIFLKHKTEALKEFIKLYRKLQISKNLPIVAVRTGYRGEFH